MIAPCPFISRGTEWLVPIVPGLVRLIEVPWKSVTCELAVARLADEVLVGGPEVREVHRLRGLDARHEQLAGAVGLGQVDGQAEVDVGRRDQVGLAVDDVEPDVHLGHRLQRLDQRVADDVGEGHLAAAGAGEVVVDDDAVVPQQLDRHRADAGRGRDGQAGVHVRTVRAGAPSQDGVGRLVARRRPPCFCSGFLRGRLRLARRPLSLVFLSLPSCRGLWPSSFLLGLLCESWPPTSSPASSCSGLFSAASAFLGSLFVLDLGGGGPAPGALLGAPVDSLTVPLSGPATPLVRGRR